MKLWENIVLVVVTATVAGVGVEWLKRRWDKRRFKEQKNYEAELAQRQKVHEAALARQSKVIETQGDLLDELAEAFITFGKALVAVSFYRTSELAHAEHPEKWREAWTKFDDSSWQLMVDVQRQLVRAEYLTSREMSRRLSCQWETWRAELMPKLEDLILNSGSNKAWSDFHEDAYRELNVNTTVVLKDLANELRLTQSQGAS